jgi:hypothetical protein
MRDKDICRHCGRWRKSHGQKLPEDWVIWRGFKYSLRHCPGFEQRPPPVYGPKQMGGFTCDSSPQKQWS